MEIRETNEQDYQQQRADQIDLIIEALRECWHESPQQRLGQLLLNISNSENMNVIWNTEDNLWLKQINTYRGENNKNS